MQRNHFLRIKKNYYNQINNGIKKLEIRVGYSQIRKIKAGDTIIFKDYSSQKFEVVRITRYDNFAEMLASENTQEVIPNVSKNKALDMLKKIYPKDKERLGVYVIELRKIAEMTKKTKRKNVIKAVIATNNKTKINGAQKALKHYYDNVDIQGINVSSDISNQPINEEIYIGAKNRINNLKKYCKQNNIKTDLYFAIESGISNQLGEWQVVSIAIIENNLGISSVSASSSFPIPEKYINVIIEKGVRDVMKNIFGDDVKQGGIELLTEGVYNRIDLIEEAFVMGLIKIIQKKWN